MTNVLPQSDVKRLRRTIRARFVLAGSLVLVVSALVAIVALLPAFFVVYVPQSAVETDGTAVSEKEQRRADQDANARVRIFLTESTSLAKDAISASEAMATAYSLRPEGISIGGMAYAAPQKEKDKGTITLVGDARSRDEVGAFRDALEKDERFESVSVPVAALVGTLEGSFTITLTGNF